MLSAQVNKYTLANTKINDCWLPQAHLSGKNNVE
jgi:hypothetical protein